MDDEREVQTFLRFYLLFKHNLIMFLVLSNVLYLFSDWDYMYASEVSSIWIFYN